MLDTTETHLSRVAKSRATPRTPRAPKNRPNDRIKDGGQRSAAKLVALLRKERGLKLSQTVEVDGEEYRVTVERRRKLPVLHERW